MVAKVPKTTCRKRKKPSDAAKSIRFAYVNSQSINALTAINDRHAQIQSFVEIHDPHFLLVAETWLSDLKSPPHHPWLQPRGQEGQGLKDRSRRWYLYLPEVRPQNNKPKSPVEATIVAGLGS